MWFLEKFDYFTSVLNGFHIRNRSIINNFLDIKNEIVTYIKNKQKPGMISFDIVKAYDTAWRPRIILKKLNNIIEKGNGLDFISNFLKHHIFQVKTFNTLSDTFPQEIGVFQGSSISVNIFLIAINNIFKEILSLNIPLLYADDFTLICRSTKANNIQQIFQDSTNKLISWSKISGFRFSPEKTSLI
jgi:hypothetical protein